MVFKTIYSNLLYIMSYILGILTKTLNPWWGFLARDMRQEPLVGESCGTVNPDNVDECCENKGYDVWDTEEAECVFTE